MLVENWPRILRVRRIWPYARFALLLTLLSFTSEYLEKSSANIGGLTLLWPSNAFLLGVLLCRPRRQWAAYVGIAYLIDMRLNASLHYPLSTCAYLALCNMLEALLAAFPLYPIMAPRPDLTQRKQMVASSVSACCWRPESHVFWLTWLSPAIWSGQSSATFIVGSRPMYWALRRSRPCI